MKRIQTYTAPGIQVQFDPNLCIHSAVCLMSLPAVFDVRRSRWVQPEAATVEQVKAAIDRCPSGALSYTLESIEPAPEHEDDASAVTTTTIQASRNGPLLVQGEFEVLDENGEKIATTGRVALCRCGGTKTQPFCDGTHRTNGFMSRGRPTG